MRAAPLALFLTACCAVAPAGEVLVLDGDTLRLQSGGLVETVRLWAIDAPELGQPGGAEARAELARLCGPPAAVVLERRGKDARGRTVARVWCSGADAGLAMLAGGHAWAYRRFSPPASYVEMEQAAIAARRGLWRDSGAVAPWVWRGR